jgi:hypothetical protein
MKTKSASLFGFSVGVWEECLQQRVPNCTAHVMSLAYDEQF